MLQEVSRDFRWNPYDAEVGKKLIKLEQTPEAIKYFSMVCDKLTDYAYWFFLSTLWVSYSGESDLNLWKELFAADRSKRKTSIMKPTEVKAFDYLPWFVTVYRAHRPNETDWIAYTLDINIAFRFAKERGVETINEYKIKKRDITALFLRRGEKEIIATDKGNAVLVKEHYYERMNVFGSKEKEV